MGTELHIHTSPLRFRAPAAERGMSLIEVMVSLIVLAIVVIGAAAFMSAGRGTAERALQERTATQIGSEYLERARASGYAAVTNGNGAVTVGDVQYTWTLAVTTGLADPADGGSTYKQMEMNVDWPTSGGRPVVVRSAIAP